MSASLHVLIPAYGPSPHLRLALESVLGAARGTAVVTVVDDASPTQDVADIAREAGADVEYVRLPENLGVAGAFQACADLSRGEYTVLMGSDDVMEPWFLDEVRDLVERFEHPEMVSTDVLVIDGDGETANPLADRVKRLRTPRTDLPIELSGEPFVRTLLTGNWLYFPAIAWRTDELRARGFRTTMGTAMDLELELRILFGAGRMAWSPRKSFRYRRHAASVSSRTAASGDRFDEERALFEWAASECVSLGWPRAARAARWHLTSRLHDVVATMRAPLSTTAPERRDLARRSAVAVISATRIATPVGRVLMSRNEIDPGIGATATWRGESQGATRLAVLAHWDARGEFAEPARLTMDGLRAAGHDVVVVSTADVDHTAFAESVGAGALGVFTRPNVGFDFASWAAALDALRIQGADPERLVLINSSMYGPLGPPDVMLDRLFGSGADVMGATESREFRPHLQSYFMAFDREAWRSERFADYWRHVRPATDKWGTILAHEQRWAHDLALPRRPAVAMVTAREVRTNRNPLTFRWREVILAGVPFVKRSLFFDNYDRIDMTGWREFVAEVAPSFDLGVIDRDVARLTSPFPGRH